MNIYDKNRLTNYENHRPILSQDVGIYRTRVVLISAKAGDWRSCNGNALKILASHLLNRQAVHQKNLLSSRCPSRQIPPPHSKPQGGSFASGT
eukprot:s3576_g15.t1